ncbi:MAG: thioredoxin domain-containing protein [Polyangiaceae bacterium]|nr:thioredoxin domain-containing protein [Polyangiaceae bacterium]
MNKGTAMAAIFASFVAGAFLSWGVLQAQGVGATADKQEKVVSKGSSDHSTAKIPVTKDDPTWGDANAPVTIVEFSDFQCPFCSRVLPTLKQIKSTYGPKKVRIVWKDQPLPFHKAARPAHEAGAAVFEVAGDEAFWKFHDLAFANSKNLTAENFKKWATEAGADPAKFEAALKNKKALAAKIAADQKLAREVGATGTPAFRINGVSLSGAQPFPKFKQVIDQQLAEAKKLTAAGTAPEAVYPTLVAKNAKKSPDAGKKKEKPVDTTVWAVPVFEDDPKKGAKEPLVTIVEFSEFQCPFCKRVLPTTKKILETYGDDVQIVWKDNPLGFHPRANPASNAARAVYAAKGDEAFWKAHDAIFASQPKLTDDDLVKALADSGVPSATILAAIKANKYKEKFEQSSEIAQDFKARGTPHFFVNGRRIAGAQPFDNFKKLIDEQLAKAKALVSKGTPRKDVYAAIMKEGKTPPPPQKKKIGPAPKDSPFKGAANAKIVIQEFSDFQCPFCSRVNPTIKQVLANHGKDVKIVWRNLPLPFHKDAPLAAEAAYEVYAQKGDKAFWEYHDKLFAGQKAPGLKREQLEKYASEIAGIDMAKFKKSLDDRTHKARIEKDAADAKAAGVSGTPAFIVGEYFVSGAQPYSAFKKAIKLAASGK